MTEYERGRAAGLADAVKLIEENGEACSLMTNARWLRPRARGDLLGRAYIDALRAMIAEVK